MSETKINAAQTGLVAGQNITLTTVQPEGGIDENTLVLFDFEQQSFANTGKGPLSFVNEPETGFTSSYKKFGEYGFVFDGTNLQYRPTASASTTWNNDFTIDVWVATDSSGRTSDLIAVRTRDSGVNGAYPTILYSDNMGAHTFYLRPFGYSNTYEQIEMANDIVLSQGFHHIAMCHKSSTRTVTAFIDGQKKASYTYESNFGYFEEVQVNKNYQSYGIYIDEFRFSNIIRYPNSTYTVPTEAYTLALPTGKTAINCPSDDLLKSITGYDATKAQTLQHNSSGVISWVDNL